MDFSRNAVLFLMFKVIFELCWNILEWVLFPRTATSLLSNLMADVTTNAGERCTDESCTENDDLLYESRATVRAFLTNVPPAVADRYVMKEDEN
jgi:hypothetical protein